MSTIYNPEADIAARIESLEIEARDMRRKIEHAQNENDRRVLNRQLKEIEEEITNLQAKLP
jgi:peptidoglycan hydrolase CwlO-like protein